MGLLALVAAGCAANAPQDYITNPVGESAQSADHLLKLVLVVAAIVFVLVEGGLLVFIVKFRRRSDSEAPVQTHGNTRAEFIWTLIPVVILAAVAFPTVKGIFAFAQEPTDAMVVKVLGKQWWWQYTYPGLGAQPGTDLVTANELHMPTGKAVKLEMTSDDVIHSYWVPRLSGKQDVVPGRVNHLTLKTDVPGTYLGQCAEYCGLSHALMRLTVVVQTPAEFEQWLEQQRQNPAPPVSNSLAARGQELFMKGRADGKFPGGPACASCHTVSGTEAAGIIGPNLTHLQTRGTFAGAIFATNPENLTKWLQDPPKAKPGSVMPKLGLTDDEVRALVAYLETLR